MTEAESCTVLLADDDRELCAALADVLATKHHRVEAVHSGQAALAACAEKPYDVLLLDVSLPDLSGLDLISRLEEVRPEMDILIITGHAAIDAAVQAVSRSTIGYLLKPLDLDRLLAILDGIAQRKRVALENRRLMESKEALIRQLEEKNAELERYTYTVSHDLTSPLITITGFLGMIEQSAMAGDVEKLRKDIARVSGATRRMKRLLDELLQLSRIGRVVNPPLDVSVSRLAREAVEMVARPVAGGEVDFRIADDMPAVRGDRVRLLQVFQNLVDNAVKFMGDQPRPVVEIGCRSGAEPVFYVRDNGIGLDPGQGDKVFGLFDQVDRTSSGSGIGLALVKRIVELHGGRVWVESEGPGRGSCFCLTLPGASPGPESS